MMQDTPKVFKIEKAKGVKTSMPCRPIARSELFPNYSIKSQRAWVPDWQVLKTHLYREGRVNKDDFLKIVFEANKYMSCLCVM